MPLLSPSRVVDSLISARLLDDAARDQALAVLASLDSAPPPLPSPSAPSAPPSRRAGLSSLVEVVAYLGAGLVLAAAALFLGETWTDLSFGSQVAGLAVAAVALGISGLLVARRTNASTDGAMTRRLASTLLTGSAVVAAGLAGLIVDHAGGTPSDGSLNWTWLVVSVVAVVVVVGGQRLAHSAFATLVLFSGLTSLVGALAEPSDGSRYLVSAAAYLVLAIGWLALAERTEVHDRLLRRVLGAGLALYAAQTPLFGVAFDTGKARVAYALTSLVVAASVAAYLRLRAWPYLAAAVIGVTIVVPEAVSDWTGGGLGVSGAVLLTGLTLVAASLLGTRLLHTRAA